MALYYLPCLIRSDRYFITRLGPGTTIDPDFNFVVYAEDRILTPLLTLEDIGRILITQVAPSGRQDIPLSECRLSLEKREGETVLLIRPGQPFSVEQAAEPGGGLRLDYSPAQKRVSVGIYPYEVKQASFRLRIILQWSETETYSSLLLFTVVPSAQCHRVVIDFGSEASQVAFRNCGPQDGLVCYDILENIINRLSVTGSMPRYRRTDFLNDEADQPGLYRSFYAVRKKIAPEQRRSFPFNFTAGLADDEIRLFITREEVAASGHAFRDEYEIIPNLKLGMDKSLQLLCGDQPEDYSIGSHKKELISALLLRLLRLLVSSKPELQRGGLIVTLLVPNIYTQHDVFKLLDELRRRTGDLLRSLSINPADLPVEYETISESDAAFMGYQQTHGEEARLGNGEMALVIDCGKGTTDISMLLADDNENYSSFYRTGFAGAGNVLLYGFVEDFLSVVLRAIPGNNNISVREFIRRYIRHQDLTADVLNFIGLMEDRKKKFGTLRPVGITEFARVAENAVATERTIRNLHRDPSTLMAYASVILKDRPIRWDEEITGLVNKAADCIVQSVISGIREVLTKDIRRRIRLVMLSGRAFYFETLRKKMESALREKLGDQVAVKTVPAGRSLNNKNVALYGAFSGAYKITDFTGIPVDRKEGLSRNRDVISNNEFLYRGIKIEPGNDILYNAAVVRRNHQALKAFKHKTVDLFFTRDNIYLRLLENQQVKDVRSLYSVLSSLPGMTAPVQDLKAISLFPNHNGELASILSVYRDLRPAAEPKAAVPVRKRKGILAFFNF